MKGSLQADAWVRAGGAPGAPQRPRSGKNLLASGCTGELASGQPRPAVSWWGGGEVWTQRQGRAWGGGPKYQPVPGRGRVCRRGGYHPDDSEAWRQTRRGLEKTGTEREAGESISTGGAGHARPSLVTSLKAHPTSHPGGWGALGLPHPHPRPEEVLTPPPTPSSD